MDYSLIWTVKGIDSNTMKDWDEVWSPGLSYGEKDQNQRNETEVMAKVSIGLNLYWLRTAFLQYNPAVFWLGQGEGVGDEDLHHWIS